MLQEAKADGEILISVEKDHLLGAGVTFRMFFDQSNDPGTYRIFACFGKLKKSDDPIFSIGKVIAILAMKIQWITIGYYYFVENSCCKSATHISAEGQN